MQSDKGGVLRYRFSGVQDRRDRHSVDHDAELNHHLSSPSWSVGELLSIYSYNIDFIAHCKLNCDHVPGTTSTFGQPGIDESSKLGDIFYERMRHKDAW